MGGWWGALVLVVATAPRLARAQATDRDEAIRLGAWSLRPSVELRVRGEFTRAPVDSGGSVYATRAILGSASGSELPPIIARDPPVSDQWWASERARLGIGVERGPVRAQLTLQDARALGSTERALMPSAAEPALPSLAPLDAYIDVATARRTQYVRVGRQQVTWGAGRLLGEDDWSPTARSLDALVAGGRRSDVDVEVLAALLAAPGALPPAAAGELRPASSGTGAQLYGLYLVWRMGPYFNVEATSLGRIVRAPTPGWLAPSDLAVVDARVFGEGRALSWDLEGAYEFGRTVSSDRLSDRAISAWALATSVELVTRLPGELTFRLRGAYASGDAGASGTSHAFDPVLPDERTTLSPMGLYAWTNLIEGGAAVTVHLTDELRVDGGYRFAGLAEPSGRWTTSALQVVGAASHNQSHVLGHEIDAAARWQVTDGLGLRAGYGLFVFGEGAAAILRSSGRYSEPISQYGYVEVQVVAP